MRATLATLPSGLLTIDASPDAVVTWLPCDPAWREVHYDSDWWYHDEDRFMGWRLEASDGRQ